MPSNESGTDVTMCALPKMLGRQVLTSLVLVIIFLVHRIIRGMEQYMIMETIDCSFQIIQMVGMQLNI